MTIRRLPECQEAVLRLCRRGRLEEALRALCAGTPSSISTHVYSTVLQLCTDLMAEREGRLLHEHISLSAVQKDLYLETKLVIFYGKISDASSARQVFDGMLQRSIVSWSAMISAYARNGLAEDALKTFISMKRDGLTPNQFAYGSVLRACTEMKCTKTGLQIHGEISKTRFSDNPFAQSALVDFHSKCGYIHDARKLFQEIKNKDLTSWNCMIGGFSGQRLERSAILTFKSMLQDGILPDQFTFASVLKASGGIEDLAMVDQIHGVIIQMGFDHHLMAAGSIIDAYAKCRKMRSARLLYDSLPEKDLISSTALISSYARENGDGDPLKLFAMVNAADMGTDDVIVCAGVSACADFLSLRMGRQIHASIFKKLPGSDVAVGNALVDMYAKCGELDDALRVFYEMRERNVVSWTSMITAFGRHGQGEAALALMEEMEREGCGPNDVTFLAALSACGHAGLTNEGRRLFQFMVIDRGIRPRAEHYACFVDLLARGGQLNEAFDFVGKMGSTICSSSLWGALLGACGVHGDVSLGKKAAVRLFHMEPESSVNYVVLSNIYASSCLWGDATSTRRLVDERSRGRKTCGYSLLHSVRKSETLLLESG